MKKLTPTQLKAVEKLKANGGKIVRLRGGYWTYPECPPGPWRETPEWNVDIRTVRALEREGFLERLYVFPEEWRDSRKLTGKAVE